MASPSLRFVQDHGARSFLVVRGNDGAVNKDD